MKVVIDGEMMPDAAKVFRCAGAIAFVFYNKLGAMDTYVCDSGHMLTVDDCIDIMVTVDNMDPVIEQINNHLAIEKLGE